MAHVRQYVVMPMGSLRAREGQAESRSIELFTSMTVSPVPRTTRSAVDDHQFRVLAEVAKNGAKLVLASTEQIRALRQEYPDVQVAPVVQYHLARALRPAPKVDLASPANAAVKNKLRVSVRDSQTGKALGGADVRAFTDFANRFGAKAITDMAGEAALDLDSTSVFIERLYVYPPLSGYWGTYRLDVMLSDGDCFDLSPVDLSHSDSLRTFLPPGKIHDGRGVRVAVIDTGVGPHPDLHASGDPDNGDGHGTHVAGIIASQGSLPDGLPGLAPGVEIYSYRVFGGNGMAPSFTVASAIDRAVQDGCDLINLSLGYSTNNAEPVVQAAISDAYNAGSLCIAAAGNEGREPVEFPASDPKTLGISALGKIGTFPAGSIDELDIAGPQGADPNDFIAAFSNVGPEIDLTGPGVGIVSNAPNGGFGWMSGTSMACPAVTGIAARLLAADSLTLSLPRDAKRTQRISQLIRESARTLGFPGDLEGLGLPG